MKLKQTIVASAIALCMGVTGLPFGGVSSSTGLLGVSEAQAQPAPRWRRPPGGRPPIRRPIRRNNNNVGVGIAGAIIGLTAGAIAADIARKNRAPAYGYRAPAYGYRAPDWCNVPACASRYRSFRAYDCTYQPYNGPRTYCRM
nr:BA14K family protein [uncultured Cohaesibacter sp.]